MLTLYADQLDLDYLAKFHSLLDQNVTVQPVDRETVELLRYGQVQVRLTTLNPSWPPLDLSRLTPRQTEVLRLLVQGATSREIAKALRITPKAVDKQVSAILAKFELPSRSLLVFIFNQQHR